MKNLTWKKIESEFNMDSNADSFRYIKTLQTKYRNMKKGPRDKIATNKYEMKKTGEGQYSPLSFNDTNNFIMEIADKNVMGLANSSYDNDNGTIH